MQVKCSLCGGENEIHPEQKMLFCSYCGSALTVDEGSCPEHLILPHERNERHAREALTSYLLHRRMPRPKDIRIEFSYVPYLMIEDEKGQMITAPGTAKVPAGTESLPYPPAGNYRFFDEKLAGNETITPVTQSEKGAMRILHLPVYLIRYTAAGATWNASAIGESWQVYADDFPPEQPSTLKMQNLLIAAGLFAAFLFIGKLGHGWLARFVVILAAASAVFTFFTLRERSPKNSEGRYE
jgi:hypothetical protein